MKNYLVFKLTKHGLVKNIFVFLLGIIFLTIPYTKSFAKENVFTIDNVKVKGVININFSREKYLDIAFLDSFEMLMNKILLTRDLQKVKNIKLKEIKGLIGRFQVLEESYRKGIYKAKFKIFYNENKIKKFLSKKNISFSQPENISAVFFPVFYINDEIQDFDSNFFYQNWIEIQIKNELINFILPLEDLDDFLKIRKMKDKIEEIDIKDLVNKYNVKSYVFALMDYQDGKLNIHVKTNFNNNKISKNFTHNVKNINDELELSRILKDLKVKITDLWKEENLVNLLMPLSIKIKFQHANLEELNQLRNIFYKISIIDNYILKEFNINNSFFKIYYYGNPKKLKTELLKFGYQLKNEQGSWHLYLNE
tara:strand:+ start:15652 stop:16749 length:1098 start_codon:yes stop_codon:yes gene_type:complete